MHRIPLQLPTRSVMWERSLPECVLFERTLNMKNVRETEAFITVLDEEAEFYGKQCYGIAEHMFWKANNCILTADPVSYSEGMFLINTIIVRAPKDSPVLTCALRLRGHLYYHDACFENASKDFEMFLHINQVEVSTKEDICEVIGHLVFCMYMMGQYADAKKYLRQYNQCKANLLASVLQRDTFVQIEKHIENFATDLKDVGSTTIPRLQDNISSAIPFKRFSIYDGPEDSICTECDLRKTDTIFVEEPMLHSVNVPYVRCELCYRQSHQQMYTCLECRYKTYCSLRCMEKDSAAHTVECTGYKQLTLIILDASTIFRIFLKIAIQLNEQIFGQALFCKNKTALQIWFNMLETIKRGYGQSFLSVIAMKPLYHNLNETQYSTLVATAFRLTIFIDKKTNIIETYFCRLQISYKQKLIIVGSLLMRIHCNLLLNTFDFEITNDMFESQVPANSHEIKSLITTSPKHDNFINDLNEYYGIDVEKEIWQRSLRILKSSRNSRKITPDTLPRNKHTYSCNPVHRVLSVYKDNIAELVFNKEFISPVMCTSAQVICAYVGEMADIQRCYFVKKFARLFHNHYSEYFLEMAEDPKSIQQLLSVYSPTINQFKHSCDPNVELIVLDNGVVVGKALRDIKRGEQLYVAFTAHHMRHSRIERQIFLQQLNIWCQCKYCEFADSDDPINLRQLIYCESCSGAKITPELNKCPKCEIQYKNLLIKYRTVINVLENELKNKMESYHSNVMTDRDVYILHLMIYLHAKKYFGPQNEYRINIELKHARFLALKNFAHQSYQIIMEVRDNILKSYDEHFIWFTYYADILLTIKTILGFNSEQILYPISSLNLMQLCDLGLYIVKGQVELIEFYELFDRECASILDDMIHLLKWKDKIARNRIAPFGDSLTKSNGRVRSVERKNRYSLYY